MATIEEVKLKLSNTKDNIIKFRNGSSISKKRSYLKLLTNLNNQDNKLKEFSQKILIN